MIWLLSFFILSLVVIHMARPRFLRRRLSGARFFKHLPPPRQSRSRIKLSKPPVTLPLILQMAVLLLCLAALVLSQWTVEGQAHERWGVWFLVDTSASMSTRQDDGSRMDAARRELSAAVREVKQKASARKIPVCFRLSAFDMERRDLMTALNGAAITAAAGQLEARPLGTDAQQLRALAGAVTTEAGGQCPVSHLVVISDLPAPGWLGEKTDLPVTWIDISRQTHNTGITAIQPFRNPLTGFIREINITLRAYGKPPLSARLLITRPDGSSLVEESLKWRADQTAHIRFKPPAAGEYVLAVTPGGAYAYDDTARFKVEDEKNIRVDWQVPHRQWLQVLGWREDSTAPHVAVKPFNGSSGRPSVSSVPTLYIAGQYSGRSRAGAVDHEIRDFMEGHPLLADVNFDAVESMALPGLELPPGYKPVMRAANGNVWLAVNDDPLSVLVPGLPTGTADVEGRVSALIFFNGLRLLLRQRPLAPLFTLTTPGNPQPSGNRIVLHPDEGNTFRTNGSVGAVGQIGTLTAQASRQPIWPILLVVALLVFLVERTVAIMRG